jgi:hypothetical protein
LCGTDNAWETVDMTSVQRLDHPGTQHGSMKAGLLCELLFKTVLSPNTSGKSMLHAYWTYFSVRKIPSVDKRIEFSGAGVFKSSASCPWEC